MAQRRLIILGTGYTGRVVYALAVKAGRTVWATSRVPAVHLAELPLARRIEFDLQSRETWTTLPEGADALWCFPAAPRALVAAWAEIVRPRLGRLVVLGSTSAYDPAPGRTSDAPQGSKEDSKGESDPMPPWLDETDPIREDLPRVQGEEWLRTHHAAIVLRVAGIYGPGRHPLHWIRDGRVTASDRFVNLVHVEDLARICLTVLERGRPGEVYNVSDGQPRRWKDICAEAARRWGIRADPGDHGPGKRVAIRKLETELGYRFRYPDLFAALEQLEPPHSL